MNYEQTIDNMTNHELKLAYHAQCQENRGLREATMTDRTTEELLKDAEEVAELDKKRTQGRWVNEKEDGCDWIWAHHDERNSCTDIAKRTRSTISPDTPDEARRANMDFMASAPQMAKLIAELTAKLREREGALIAVDEVLKLVENDKDTLFSDKLLVKTIRKAMESPTQEGE